MYKNRRFITQKHYGKQSVTRNKQFQIQSTLEIIDLHVWNDTPIFLKDQQKNLYWNTQKEQRKYISNIK